MIAVDTNVVVRLIVADNADQLARAKRLFETQDILVPLTVLVETVWVLRRTYKLDKATAAEAIDRLTSLANVSVDEPERFAWALGAYRSGMDFADAVHVAASGSHGRFATFDRKSVTAARRSGIDAFEP